jgi:hypothetical protein
MAMAIGLACAAWAADAPQRPVEKNKPSGAVNLATVEPLCYPPPESLSEAGKLRLRAERVVMAAEFAANPDNDPALVKRVVAQMNDGAKDTVQDNFDRFAKALAEIDFTRRGSTFRRAYELYRQGKWEQVIAALEPLMFERGGVKTGKKHNTMPPFSYVIAKTLHAECCGRVGDLVETAIAYQIIFRKLPGNLTFSATARFRAAALYEQTARPHYALAICKSLAAVYADMLDDEENLRLAAKIDALLASDPYRAALMQSSQNTARLFRCEGGPLVRQTGGNMLRLLAAMNLFPDEEPVPFEHCEQIVQGGDKSELKEGGLPKMLAIGDDPDMTGSDDWGKLRPREKQELLQMFNEMYPQRYREMLESYYKNMSVSETNGARTPR